jgi:uncharacterized protein YcbX
MARIAALHLYPLKGGRGLALDAASVHTTGLAHASIADREWMAVDREGRFITQGETPRLALIETRIERDALVLGTEDAPALHVDARARTGPACDVVVWRSDVRGHDEGDEAARWLSAQLRRPARLVRFDRTKIRPCNTDYVGDSGAHTLFADGYPVLMIGSASLADLNARLARSGEGALPMNRFRPNIVLDGLEPYDEDHIDTLSVGPVTLKLVKPCIRCQVTTTDQATATVGIEPLPTLAGYRHDAQLGGVKFGMNAIVTHGAGATLRAGTDVTFAYRF